MRTVLAGGKVPSLFVQMLCPYYLEKPTFLRIAQARRRRGVAIFRAGIGRIVRVGISRVGAMSKLQLLQSIQSNGRFVNSRLTK